MNGVPEQPGRYAERHLIGRGGMGVVAAHHDHVLDREIARKAVRPDRDPARLRSLLVREARVMARLDHPNIPPVYELGVGADGTPFYTMRRVRGRRLGELVAEAGGVEARLRLLPALIAAGQAVAFAHRREVLHRDLSPANVLVGDLGETFVIDWGLAVADEARGVDPPTLAPGVGSGPDGTPTVAGGGPPGTPGYIAPELYRGGSASTQSDQWSLGALLALLLLGRTPRGAPTAAEVPPGVPAPLVSVARRAMDPHPGARYPDVAGFVDDLLAWRDGRRVGAHAYTSREVGARLVRAHPTTFAVGVVGIAGVLLVAGVGTAVARAEAQGRLDAQAGRDGMAALVALSSQRYAEAADLAQASLRVREDPEVRGVLVAAARAWLPRVVGEVPVEGCARLSAPLSGGRALCEAPTGLTLVDPTTGAVLATSPIQLSANRRPAQWSEDGALVAGLRPDGSAAVLDAATLELRREVAPRAHGGPSRDQVAFVPGTHDLVIGDHDHTWVSREDASVLDLALASNWVAVGRGAGGDAYTLVGDSGRMDVYRGASMRDPLRAEGGIGGLAAFVPARAETLITTAFAGGSGRVYGLDLATGKARLGEDLRLGGNVVIRGAASGEVWVQGLDGRVALVSPETLALMGDLVLPGTPGREIAILDDGEALVPVTDADGSQRILRLARADRASVRRVAFPDENVVSVTPGADGGRVLVALRPGRLVEVDVASGARVREWGLDRRPTGSLVSVGDRLLALAADAGSVWCSGPGGDCVAGPKWPLRIDVAVRIPGGGLVGWGPTPGLTGLGEDGTERWFAPLDDIPVAIGDGRPGGVFTVALMEAGWARLDDRSGATLASGPLARDLWGEGVFGADGSRLYGYSRSHETLVALSLPAGEVVAETLLPSRAPRLALSPSGRTLAAGLLDGTVRLYDAATLTERAVLRADDGEVWGVAFVDERTLASAHSAGAVRFWALEDLWGEGG